MPLHPTQALTSRSLECKRLFVEKLSIIVEYRIDSTFYTAHGELQVLYQACCAPTDFLEKLCLKAHACTTKEISHIQIVTG
ncbi:hypothetical protein D3C80_1270920 [compost metagenome]